MENQNIFSLGIFPSNLILRVPPVFFPLLICCVQPDTLELSLLREGRAGAECELAVGSSVEGRVEGQGWFQAAVNPSSRCLEPPWRCKSRVFRRLLPAWHRSNMNGGTGPRIPELN